MIKEFAKDFGVDFTDFTKQGKEFYQVTSELADFTKDFQEFPLGAGLSLGKIDKKNFIPTPALLNIIAKQTKQKMMLNKQGSWLFICGRDIFEENVLQAAEKSPLIVLNENSEVLGYAVKKGKQYLNKYDIGYLLRREQ